ncbi:hypothetical protein EK904_008182 [Melospiza melodia maxima]|nr:hypothetical protein EK904_008182 [Melospiza melodia maxima]
MLSANFIRARNRLTSPRLIFGVLLSFNHTIRPWLIMAHFRPSLLTDRNPGCFSEVAVVVTVIYLWQPGVALKAASQDTPIAQKLSSSKRKEQTILSYDHKLKTSPKVPLPLWVTAGGRCHKRNAHKSQLQPSMQLGLAVKY